MSQVQMDQNMEAGQVKRTMTQLERNLGWPERKEKTLTLILGVLNQRKQRHLSTTRIKSSNYRMGQIHQPYQKRKIGNEL